MNDLFRALPALLKQFDDNETLREAVVLAAWKKIAGESLRRHTVPLGLFGTHLAVAVANKTWRKHLEELSGQMIFRLNSVLGSAIVTFIEFRIDAKAVESERRRLSPEEVSDEDLIREALGEVDLKLLSAAAAIRDEDLRYQFLLAAGGCLARTRRINEAGK